MRARMAALPMLAAVLLVTACGGSPGASHQPPGHQPASSAAGLSDGSSSPPPQSPPPPGHQSPDSAVAGFVGNLLLGRTADACGYDAPSIRDLCTVALDFAFDVGKPSGSWSIGASVTSGPRAIVAVELRNACLGTWECVSNSNPDAGLPHAGFPFSAAYQSALTGSVPGYANDCVLIDGRWYVWNEGSGSESPPPPPGVPSGFA